MFKKTNTLILFYNFLNPACYPSTDLKTKCRIEWYSFDIVFKIKVPV